MRKLRGAVAGALLSWSVPSRAQVPPPVPNASPSPMPPGAPEQPTAPAAPEANQGAVQLQPSAPAPPPVAAPGTPSPPGAQPPGGAPPPDPYAPSNPTAPGPYAPYSATPPSGPYAPQYAGGYAPVPFLYEPPPPVNSWPEPEVSDFDRFRLAAISESAFSADEGPFYNHLLGGRFDFRFSESSSVGLYLAYANLKGTQSRVHSMLGLLQYEYRFYFGATRRFSVPMRVGLGHLVHNGTPVRFSAGFFYALSDTVDIGTDLVAPMFWPASGDTVISMNLSAEVSVSF